MAHINLNNIFSTFSISLHLPIHHLGVCTLTHTSTHSYIYFGFCTPTFTSINLHLSIRFYLSRYDPFLYFISYYLQDLIPLSLHQCIFSVFLRLLLSFFSLYFILSLSVRAYFSAVRTRV